MTLFEELDAAKEEIARLERMVENAMWEFRGWDCPACYHESDENFSLDDCNDDCECPNDDQITTCWRKWLEREVKDAAEV